MATASSVAAVPPPVLFSEGDRKTRRIRELFSLFDRLAQATALRGRLDALERLSRWLVVSDKSIPAPAGVAPGSLPPPEWRRLGILLAVLERTPDLRAPFIASISSVLGETSALRLLADTGLPNDRGLAHETTDRLFRRILPTPRDEHDLSKLLLRLFPSKRELAWIEGMSPDLFHRLAETLAHDDKRGLFEPVLAAVADSLCLLGARIQALGLSEEIRARGRPGPLRSSPFFRLPRAFDVFVALFDAPARRIEAEREWRSAVEGCREEIRIVIDHLEATGISIDVVYALEVIEQGLRRMECLLGVLAASAGPERATAAHRLVLVLARARVADRSLRELARTNLRLLARKIIERAGKTGEHYITYTRREYWQMLASAAGGGFLTTGTAALKIIIAGHHYPLFIEGVFAGANYAVSFIIMQLLGFTLATKQPSMTAATLAGVIRESSGPSRVEELVTQVARICRSQLAAAMGNVGMVSVGAIGFDLFWRWRSGQSFLSVDKIDYVVGSLHPLQSGTVFFAILTGVILWLSSLAAGWVENFVVYRRLPQAVAEHRMGRFVGERMMGRMAAAFARNISGFGGSIALGIMLGMCPIVGKFVGLPLDVRHVTLSTGTLALAASSIGSPIFHNPAFWWAVAGIGVIFVCNLGASFTLALAVALRAREVSSHDRFQLLSALIRRLLRSPGEFLFPPRSSEPPATPTHH